MVKLDLDIDIDVEYEIHERQLQAAGHTAIHALARFLPVGCDVSFQKVPEAVGLLGRSFGARSSSPLVKTNFDR
jgi:hypothetical protein